VDLKQTSRRIQIDTAIDRPAARLCHCVSCVQDKDGKRPLPIPSLQIEQKSHERIIVSKCGGGARRFTHGGRHLYFTIFEDIGTSFCD